MNDNTTLLTHMRTDPNASKHAAIGLGVSLGGIIWILALHSAGLHANVFCAIPLLLPLLSGIGIEIMQRIQGGRNSARESIMDILTTWLWPLFYIYASERQR